MSEPNEKAIEGEALEQFKQYLNEAFEMGNAPFADFLSYHDKEYFEELFREWCEDKATRQ